MAVELIIIIFLAAEQNMTGGWTAHMSVHLALRSPGLRPRPLWDVSVASQLPSSQPFWGGKKVK